ncbi:amidohydrolase [Hellea balneolensis]|uniref:amidohydrolase n=1 Tax=Hellea balneolensis TaxID=287478 RepID=UPI0003F919B3|nr:amidohydrolase [Hellea balneolensis]
MKVKYFTLAAALFCGACQNAAEQDAQKDATVFTNGTIITMDPQNPIASQLIIQGDKISALKYPEDDFKISDRSSANIVDLGGRTILPGIIDSHVHVRELGMDAVKADLVGVKNTAQIVDRLKQRFPNPNPGQWLIGQGWDEGIFASIGYPDRAELDEAFPNNPVKLESLHGFGGFYNGAALAIAEIDKATPEPEVGNILRRENGEPTGVMLTLAQDLVNRHVPAPTQTQLEEAISAGLYKMAKAGVTSVHEAGMTPQDVAAFKALAERDELPIRVYGMLDGNDGPLMKHWFATGPLDDPQDFLDIRGVKVFYDGSLGSRTALMAAPYSDQPDKANPTERITPEAVFSLGQRSAKYGFQMAVHAIGDEGNNRTLGLYEKALETQPPQDHRWRIEHAQVVLPDFYKRQAALGVIASMQSSHAVGDSKWAEDRVGPDRIRHAYAWQTILDNGGRLLMNSDLPGEPWEPMETLYFAVNRKPLNAPAEAEGWYMEQTLSVPEALKSMTIENAYGAFQEDNLGSIEPGKWADFIVLDANPMTVPPHLLKDIQVEQTWVAGRKLN